MISMAKKFMFRGKTLEELKAMGFEEFSMLPGSRLRRSLKRGLTKTQKKLLKRLRKSDRLIRTHARDMPVLPEMIGKTIGIHNGKAYMTIEINENMLGHVLGEFVLTRSRVKHSSPGIGATRSSRFVPLK